MNTTEQKKHKTQENHCRWFTKYEISLSTLDTTILLSQTNSLYLETCKKI